MITINNNGSKNNKRVPSKETRIKKQTKENFNSVG